MYKLKTVVAGKKRRMFKRFIFHSRSPILSKAVIDDINHDGKKEIVFGTKYGDVTCIDEAGDMLWSFNVHKKAVLAGEHTPSAVRSAPVIEDLDNDGQKKILFGTENGKLFCLSHDGKMLWNKEFNAPIRATPAVADINNDGYLEIIVPCSDSKIYILSHKGRLLHSFKADSPLESTPCILKGRDIQLIVGSDAGTLYSLNPDCSLRWMFQAENSIKAEPSCAVHKGEFIVFSSLSGHVHLLDRNGKLVWVLKTKGPIYAKAEIADINGDKVPEIVVASTDGKVYALTMSRGLLWSYETGSMIVSDMVVDDIDSDGFVEVVVGGYDAKVHILDGRGDYRPRFMPGMSQAILQGRHLSEFIDEEPLLRVARKICDIDTDGVVVGCSLFKEGDKMSIIVNIRSGFVEEIIQ